MHSHAPGPQSGLPQIEPLAVEDLTRFVPRDWSFPYSEARETVRRNPNFAYRVAGTGEYVIGGRWRRRAEIASVEYLRASTHRTALLSRLAQSAVEAGATLLVLAGTEQAERIGFYRAEGFQLVDEIVRFQRQSTVVPPPTLSDTRLLATEDRDALLAVDHAAFPWLWWNSAEEFTWYLSLPGVEAHVAVVGGQVVGYVSFTITGTHGHIDRLAVHPAHQGRQLGAQLVRLSLVQMARRGVQRVALTTQVNNHRSARLYSALGFTRTNLRFPLYGRWLHESAAPLESSN